MGSSPNSAVAEPEPIDPMSQLEEISNASAVTPKKRKCYISKRGKNHVTDVQVSESEPASHPTRRELRKVTLYAVSTNSLWLCIDDIPWLVKWMTDEIRSGGVPMALDDPLDALACNCEADKVHFRWGFSGAWEAITLKGDTKGSKVKSCVAKFNEEKWLAIGGYARYGTDFGSATPDQVKAAIFQFLEKHMQEVVHPQLRV